MCNFYSLYDVHTIPIDTTSVTDILRALKLPYVGKSGMFSSVATSKNVGEGLSGKGGITDPIELGNLLEYLIEKYLHDKQEFKGTPTKIYSVSDEKFGAAAWDLIKSKMIQPTAKLLEQPLVGYGANGRADCIIRRKDLPTIIIDFKWTAANYPNPSPGYALQLLLYQWMEGQQYKEGKGAEMYLIRFCEKEKLMQLIPFIPPAKMQYTSDSKVTSYVEICNQFCTYYGYPKLGEVDEEICSEIKGKLSLN